jgi:3-oxoacyl-[acyl-carrier-protein] synthase-1/3-oxoacyl-[acyl-carrier-protein] synthase II
MGIISCHGKGISQTSGAIQNGLTAIRPLSLFPTASNQPLPVGEVSGLISDDVLPRTHQLARLAADQAMANTETAPDAVVMGVTTGGMLTTEGLLKENVQDPKRYRLHATGSVAVDIAHRYRCSGPALTVSTACSSGAAAIKIALELLRSGSVQSVLAGGADSLCRLTYYGFNSLQLVDPEGARPFDQNRRGMSVAEGAAVLLLVANEPVKAVAEVMGAGVSCDAYHPATPHPQGQGARAAMQAAIEDAGISVADIDYINLHGTGTLDNDISEARAIHTLFRGKKPLLSSIKGACGHSLAAAGAIEAVVSAISISSGVVPATVGCRRPDPDLELDPVMQPSQRPIETVLSNSFGFGGNNAAIVLGACGKPNPDRTPADTRPMPILGSTCITGAGRTDPTMKAIGRGEACAGMLDLQEVSANLSAGQIRRLKRFPRLVLSLAVAAHENSGTGDTPAAVYLGTGWGALSETSDFLKRLFETDEQFPSPIDFVGSVHNAAAGQVAMQLNATGANITMTGGDYSFEQSLMTAGLLSKSNNDPFLVIGADESHPELSPLFDRSVSNSSILSDGGGALCLKNGPNASGLTIDSLFFESSQNNPEVISSLIQQLEQLQPINERYGMILAGIPAACRNEGKIQLQTLLSLTGYHHPVIDYRKVTGEFASASAVAAVMAVKFLQEASIPKSLCQDKQVDLSAKGALIIGTGGFITAMEVMPQ